MRHRTAGLPPGFPLLADPGDELRQRCGVPADSAAVFIADRWGQVYDRTLVGRSHGFPTIEDVTAWFRFLATQCPECGVIDEPGRGEWGEP